MHRQLLDKIDLQLIKTLQEKGHLKLSELSDLVGLSIPTVSERLHKLESEGVISGYRAIINKEKVGLEITAFIFIVSESSKHYEEVVEKTLEIDQILECHAITGSGSHLLKVCVPKMENLEKLLSEIQTWPGVKNTTTDIVLSTAKETTELNLIHLRQAQNDKEK